MLNNSIRCFVEKKIMRKIINNRVRLNLTGKSVGARLKKTVDFYVSRHLIHESHQLGVGRIDPCNILFAALRAEYDRQWIALQGKDGIVEYRQRDDGNDQRVREKANFQFGGIKLFERIPG